MPPIFSSTPKVLFLLVLAGLPSLACKPKEEPPPPPPSAALCGGSGGSSGIQDYPCSAATVEGWVSNRQGHRQRNHAWYLFAGLNQPANGTFLWRTWPTSTQAFPGQFGAAPGEGSAHLALGPLPGAILEHPAEGTPRFAGSDAAPAGGAPGAIDDQNLALPGGPRYSVPPQVLANPAYVGCIHNTAAGPALIDGPRFQNNGDVMVAGVIYSPPAAQWILSNNLYNAGFLDSKVPPGTGTTTQATQMPSTSVVLKPMLWPVPNDRFVALPQWGFADPNADRLPNGCEVFSGFERKDLWTDAVAVTAMVGPQQPTADATYLNSPSVQLAVSYGPPPKCTPTYAPSTGITYTGVPTADLGKFYTVRFTGPEFASLAACDRALLDQSAYWAYGRAFGQNDVLVLVAMHMMTKEQPGWTFQSAWWYRDAATCTSGDCARFAGDRPADVQGAGTFKNYLMTTTYGQNQQPGNQNTWPPSLASNTTWPVAFNPYIELAATHPIETNCINCHRRAAWPSRITKSREYPNRSSAYLVAGSTVPGLLDQFQLSNPVFNGLTTVDSMWAISDRAYYRGASDSAEPATADPATPATPPAAAPGTAPSPQP